MTDHEEAQDFTALGPTSVGFRTRGARIQKGVDVIGTAVGVAGQGGTPDVRGIGVSGFAHGIGVQGIGVDGVGVQGISRGESGADCIGVTGSSQAEDGIGVSASGTIGIRASGSSYGGTFSSMDGAQIHLKPAGVSVEEPPRTGRAGDLFVLRARATPDELDRFGEVEDRYLAQLWFCLRDNVGENPAVWGKVSFSEFRP
jgi:hypothetical protein